MDNKLYMERKKRKRKMSGKKLEHTFVIGVIYNDYDKKFIEALKLYDIKKKEVCIQSLEKIKQRLEGGDRIIGIHLRYFFKKDTQLVSQIVFENGAYNCRMVDILNGKGEVIEPQKSTIIGIKETDKNDYFIVMNGDCEISYISKEEVINKQFNGITNRGLICLNSCQKLE